MALVRLMISAAAAALTCAVASGQAYLPHAERTVAMMPVADAGSSSSSRETGTDAEAADVTAHDMQATPSAVTLWRHPGVGLQVGLNGIGIDIAEPVAQHFNVRVGGEYFRYTGDFTSDGAQINADLTVGGGKVALDYFPWHNGFHVSPQVRFAIQTAANVKVIVPAGQQISLDGSDYVSSPTDPLRGTGYVDSRKTAVGITVGYGNLSPRHGAHWSFPVEAGFYYIGQPNLTVTFTGSACDPTQPAAIGCQKVDNDPGFQNDLKKFIARQNNNLSYASFFPVASFGVGYRF